MAKKPNYIARRVGAVVAPAAAAHGVAMATLANTGAPFTFPLIAGAGAALGLSALHSYGEKKKHLNQDQFKNV